MNVRPRFRPASRPTVEPLEGRQLLTIFTVTNVGDSGPGSLRQEILDADAANVPSRVVFQLTPPPVPPGVLPVVRLSPLTALPAIGSGVVIDGTTQTGYSATTGPVVAINGGQSSSGEGLVIAGDRAGVIGLTVQGFAGDPILAAGQYDLIQANRLGGDVLVAPRFLGSSRTGLSLLGSGRDFLQDNVITGATYGIFIGPGSSLDVLQGNFSQYNDYGLYSINGTGNTIGSTTGNNTGNQFTNNGTSGLVLIDTDPPSTARPQGNVIAGNVISANGSTTGGSENLAAVALISSSGDTIGGATPASANQIVNNFGDGLSIGTDAIDAPGGAVASGDLVEGNLIGGSPSITSFGGPTGTPIGNRGNAVVLGAGSSGNAVASNDLSYNGNLAVLNQGTGNVVIGDSQTHDGQRQVDFGVYVRVVSGAGSEVVGSKVEVDFTVYNQGSGYADQAGLTLDFSGAPGLVFDSTSGSGLQAGQPKVTRRVFTFAASDHYQGTIPGTGWLPKDQATLRVFFTVTKAGPESIQSVVTSGDSYDTNPADKVDVLTFTTS